MAHIEKYQSSALGNMLGHYERRAELENGYERENIDPERTHLNYNLCEHPSPLGFVEERIGELDLKRAPRKDAVRMVDTVVTLPAAYHGDVREFMEAVKETLDGIFGAENCVGAWVHMDETTPHMHYASVPVTGDGRLSAKSLLNRTFMKQFHDRLESGVCERLGIERAGLTLTDEEREQRAGKYVGLAEYKAAHEQVRRMERRCMELGTEIADKEGELYEIDDAIADRELRLQDLGEQVEQETRRLESVRRAVEEKQLEPAPQTLSESLRTLWATRNDGGREESLAGEVEDLRSRVSELERENQRAGERVSELERRRGELAGRVEYLRGAVARAAERFEQLAATVRGAVCNVGERVAALLGELGVEAYPGNEPLKSDAYSLASELRDVRDSSARLERESGAVSRGQDWDAR